MTTIEDMNKTDLKCPACGEELYHNPTTSHELLDPNVPDEEATYGSKHITEGFEFRCKKCWAYVIISEDQMEEHEID